MRRPRPPSAISHMTATHLLLSPKEPFASSETTRKPAYIDESPLATWEPSKCDSFPQTTAGKRTLEISAGCVRLILKDQESVLLVWPEPTSWSASSQVIDFVGPLGERLELPNGDAIMSGGATATREPQFISPPDPSCKTEGVFVLHPFRVPVD